MRWCFVHVYCLNYEKVAVYKLELKEKIIESDTLAGILLFHTLCVVLGHYCRQRLILAGAGAGGGLFFFFFLS